ncbi:hypothetical protein ABZW11_20785 [Nonomuraea sp. NPDC004580]|uniref:hypothetical protein n=1 Tax=Nonomuraea sp. NPDC004580 TaxID=3154552 RepID=UPI0033B4B0CB
MTWPTSCTGWWALQAQEPRPPYVGGWQSERSGKKAELLVSPFVATDLGQVKEEGLRLPAFAEPDATTTALEVTGAQ